MSDIMVLSATARDRVGKGAARSARRAGLIPAVIYGDKKSPVTINLNDRAFTRYLHEPGFFAKLVDVEIDSVKHRVLPRDVQFHPVSDRAEHVDFLRVSASTVLSVEVPVEFTGEEECPGLRQGGVLNVVRYTIEINCTPDKIPASIAVSLAGAEMGDSIHITSVPLPDGVTPAITDRDFTIATIASPTVTTEETTVDGADGDAAGGDTEGAADGAGDGESA